ncbi:unnamed protein product [Natator depressus]
MSYAEKKWNAFRAYSGLENITSRDHDVFLQILKEGLSADHQAVLALGISVGETYSAVMKWATEVEHWKKRKVAATTSSEEITAVHAIKTTTCFTCNKLGHLAHNCKNKNKIKICSNCKRSSHLKEDCFHPGGGKEGQWPNKQNKPDTTSTQEQEKNKQIQELLKLLASK